MGFGGTRPLEGVRVLDLSRVLAGPVCSMVLADLGAEVIKVERPGKGDDTREWGPPFIEEPEGLRGMSAYFAAVNRNKRSITLDIAKPRGQEVLRRLLERSHVLLENFLPAAVSKFGISPENLQAINPRLIVCSISGFGRSGPWAELPGYDYVVQALSGLMSITGEPDGRPIKVGVALTDVLTGLYGAVSIVALLHRQRGEELSRSGAPASVAESRVNHIDLALLDCTLASLVNVVQSYLVTGQRPARYGNAHPQIVPYECFQTRDGYIVLAVGNDDQFRRFCLAVGREELARDSRFTTNPQRVIHRVELVTKLKQILESDRTSVWTERLEQAEVPHAPVLPLDETLALPQIAARRMVVVTPDGLRMVASQIKLDGELPPDPSAPPKLGEHTEEVLCELGFPPTAFHELHAAGIV